MVAKYPADLKFMGTDEEKVALNPLWDFSCLPGELKEQSPCCLPPLCSIPGRLQKWKEGWLLMGDCLMPVVQLCSPVLQKIPGRCDKVLFVLLNSWAESKAQIDFTDTGRCVTEYRRTGNWTQVSLFPIFSVSVVRLGMTSPFRCYGKARMLTG